MAGNQMAVLRDDEIRLNKISSLKNRHRKGGQRVLGYISARPPVCDHNGPVLVVSVLVI